ncbi:MAG TPA: hypothetical protein DEH27_05030 [Deltaproteobacteria bacterium]|nr:hypothetical protein [Deltaproteobacteria bacterium]
MVASVRKNEKGMTLLETVVALAIVFIVFLGLADAGLLVFDFNINNAIRDEGVKVTEMEMATVRGTSYSTLNDPVLYPDNVAKQSPNGSVVPRQIRGLTVNYAPRWTVIRLNADNLQVAINVAWQRSAWTSSGRALRNYSHQVTTIVRNR